jgi:Na+-driven multidrug efflux pump
MLNTYITGIATIVNIILYIFWIPKYGILGASWAASISHVIALSITLVVYCKISGNKIKDVIFIKKSDLKVYHDIFITFKERFK